MGAHIVGRAAEVQQVLAFLDDRTPEARAIALYGKAGIGKTTHAQAISALPARRSLATLPMKARA